MTSRIAIFEFLNFAICNFAVYLSCIETKFWITIFEDFQSSQNMARKTFKSLLNLKSFKRFQIM